MAELSSIANQAKSTDIFILYLAGHGVTLQDDYYFLCQDAQSANLTDPEVRQSWTISSRELTDAIKRIPAVKQVLILDTCASGRFIEKLTDRREVPSAQIRALERVKDATGMHILAGCAADSVSYEATRYAQGLLTHSLLMGMRGAALKNDELVDVLTLFNFSTDKVPELAHDVGGIQRPVYTSPRGGKSFEFGQVTDADRSLIPLQAVRPMVVRTTLVDEKLFADQLKFSRRVDEALRGRSVMARGARGLVFVDAPDFPEGYQVTGSYQSQAGKVTVRITLRQELQGKLQEVVAWQVDGRADAMDELAGQIAEQVEDKLPSR
jgi:hypothetical protein